MFFGGIRGSFLIKQPSKGHLLSVNMEAAVTVVRGAQSHNAVLQNPREQCVVLSMTVRIMLLLVFV